MKYSSQQLEHFYNALHAGKLDENDSTVIVVEEGSGDRGNVVRLYLQIQNKKIRVAKFLAYGSVALIACCEYVCRYLEGKTIDEAIRLSTDTIMQDLGMSTVEIHNAIWIVRLVKKSL